MDDNTYMCLTIGDVSYMLAFFTIKSPVAPFTNIV